MAYDCPSTLCTRHVLCMYDSVTKGIATYGCRREDLVKVALIKVADRAFPKEIFVTDAEYVYRDANGYFLSRDKNQPYFYNDIPDGEYVGKSKREKQFNSACPEH